MAKFYYVGMSANSSNIGRGSCPPFCPYMSGRTAQTGERRKNAIQSDPSNHPHMSGLSANPQTQLMYGEDMKVPGVFEQSAMSDVAHLGCNALAKPTCSPIGSWSLCLATA